MDKLRMNALERDQLMELAMVSQILNELKDTGMTKRLRLIPGGKRDLAMLAAKAKRLKDAALETVPEDQYGTLVRNLLGCTFTFGVRRPVAPRTDYGVWLSVDQYNTLIDHCRMHCELCQRDTAASRKACPLRKTVEQIAVYRAEERPDGDCPFYGW